MPNELSEPSEPFDDIYTLYHKVTQHPDFAGGAIFTRAHVAYALFAPDDGWRNTSPLDDPDHPAIAKVTEEMLVWSPDAFSDSIFASDYNWVEYLQDNWPGEIDN